MNPTRAQAFEGTDWARVTISRTTNHARSMSTILILTAFACLIAGIRARRASIPTEDATPLNLNRRRGMGFAAALNLSRAVRRMN